MIFSRIYIHSFFLSFSFLSPHDTFIHAYSLSNHFPINSCFRLLHIQFRHSLHHSTISMFTHLMIYTNVALSINELIKQDLDHNCHWIPAEKRMHVRSRWSCWWFCSISLHKLFHPFLGAHEFLLSHSRPERLFCESASERTSGLTFTFMIKRKNGRRTVESGTRNGISYINNLIRRSRERWDEERESGLFVCYSSFVARWEEGQEGK